MTIDERFDQLDRTLEGIRAYLLEFRTEIIQRLEFIDRRLDVLSTAVTNLDARLPAVTKAVLDSQSMTAEILRSQAAGRQTAADLASRVARLEEQVARLLQSAA